jgi:quinolinate synthase
MYTFTKQELDLEANRLFTKMSLLDCDPRRTKPLTWNDCRAMAELTLEINARKKDQNTIILAHSYVDPDIIYGVADHVGDSLQLSSIAKNLAAPKVLFVGVVFMAESTKLLSPTSTVWVPDRNSGCSLADSLTPEKLLLLKKQYPNAAVVSYINCNANIKALSDICVTSTNVYDIIAALPQKEILFVPDMLMAENVRTEMRARNIDKVIYTSDGTCLVHDKFSPDLIVDARKRFPGLKVVSHPECPKEITALSDYVGSTSGMMSYVKTTTAPYFMMLTECGLVSRLEIEAPEKNFIGSCKLCPFMKLNTLHKVLETLRNPKPEQEITLPLETMTLGAIALERMLEASKPKK